MLIDDLDRCKAPYIVELLEGIQTLFRDVPVAYVVAADREWLADSYEAEYLETFSSAKRPGRRLGHLFLEKTFQISTALPGIPEPVRAGYWHGLLRPTPAGLPSDLKEARRNASEEFAHLQDEDQIRRTLVTRAGHDPVVEQARVEAAAIQLATPEVERTTTHALQLFLPLLESNPRAMKRLVNAYGVARDVEVLEQRNVMGSKAEQHQTALWTILNLRWPVLATFLAANPRKVELIADEGDAADADLADVQEDLKSLFRNSAVAAVVQGRAPGVVSRLDHDAIDRLSGNDIAISRKP